MAKELEIGRFSGMRQDTDTHTDKEVMIGSRTEADQCIETRE